MWMFLFRRLIGLLWRGWRLRWLGEVGVLVQGDGMGKVGVGVSVRRNGWSNKRH